MNADVLTAAQAAEELGLSIQSLLRWQREERVHGWKVGRRWFFNRIDIASLLHGNTSEAR